jgi:glycosyltransferase 2 family protein
MTIPTSVRRYAGRFLFVIAVCLSVLLVVRVLYASSGEIVSIMSGNGRIEFAALAVLLLFVNQILCISRWRMLGVAAGIELGFREVIDIAVFSECASFVLPSANGGDVLKITAFSQRPETLIRIAVVTLTDRLTGLFGLLLLAGVVGVATSGAETSAPRLAGLAAIMLLLFGMCGLFALVGRTGEWIVSAVSRMPLFVGHLVREVSLACQLYQGQKRVMFAALAMSVFSQLCVLSAMYSLLIGIVPKTPVTWIESLSLFPWVLVSMAIPLPGGALGVSENVSEMLFQSLGQGGGGLTCLAFRVAFAAATLLTAVIWLAVRRHVGPADGARNAVLERGMKS